MLPGKSTTNCVPYPLFRSADTDGIPADASAVTPPTVRLAKLSQVDDATAEPLFATVTVSRMTPPTLVSEWVTARFGTPAEPYGSMAVFHRTMPQIGKSG